MSHMIKVKQGDTARKLTDTLTIDGSPIDLTACTVVLIFSSAGGISRRSATIVSATEGTVEYQLVSSDVSVAGFVQLEWEVTFDDDTVLTAPTDGYIKMKIYEELG